MKHASHKATKVSRQQFDLAKALFSSGRGIHSRRSIRAKQAAGSDAIALGLDPVVAARINEIAPQSRRSIRQAARAAERRNYILASASLAALVGTVTTALAFSNMGKSNTPMLAETTTTTPIKRVSASDAASRNEARAPLSSSASSSSSTSSVSIEQGKWSTGGTGTDLDTNLMSHSVANNPTVAALMDADYGQLPEDFDPNHDSGDQGNAYPWGQCTWYAYQRRAELGLPTGSVFGNASSWAVSATAAGYWVDGTARHVGDVVVFAPGQENADLTYGHVAVVEKINADGSIEVSESNAQGLGVISQRSFSAEQAAQFQYIHY